MISGSMPSLSSTGTMEGGLPSKWIVAQLETGALAC